MRKGGFCFLLLLLIVSLLPGLTACKKKKNEE